MDRLDYLHFDIFYLRCTTFFRMPRSAFLPALTFVVNASFRNTWLKGIDLGGGLDFFQILNVLNLISIVNILR